MTAGIFYLISCMLKPAATFLTVVFASFILISCLSKNQSLHKTWFFAYYGNSGQSLPQSQPLTPENFLNLQKDGKYTSYLSGFDYGTWKNEGNEIHLVNEKGEKKFLRIILLKDGELTLDLSSIFRNSPIQVFTGIPNTNTKEADDPFSKQNNQWRIRASAPETSEQIKARLVNHFRFWEKYFEWAIANNLKSLGVRGMNSPIKIYGNGFALIPYNELPDEWNKIFFDEADCRKAYDKLETMMNTKDVTWPKTDNRFKSFISGFQQLQGMVE